jgi:hypothetical protein
MPEITEWNPEDPRKIYDALIERCKEVKIWTVRCLVDEVFVVPDKIPNWLYDVTIVDGVFYFAVIASNFRDARLRLLEVIPVIKFLDEDYE